MTPMMSPRELPIEPLSVGAGVDVSIAVLEDGEVADEDSDEADDTDNNVDGDEDAGELSDASVSVGWELIVGEAEGVADPKMGFAVSVSA